MLHSILELTFILATRRVVKNPVSIELIVLEVSFIDCFIGKDLATMTMLLVMKPMAIIEIGTTF